MTGLLFFLDNPLGKSYSIPVNIVRKSVKEKHTKTAKTKYILFVTKKEEDFR